MRKADIKGIYIVNKAPNPVVLGYKVEINENGTLTQANLSNSKMLQEVMLKTLNENGWLFRGVSENKATSTIFPLFTHVREEKNKVPLLDILKLDNTKRQDLLNRLTQEVKFDLSYTDKYKKLLKPYPPVEDKKVQVETAPQPTVSTQPTKPVVETKPVPTPQPVVETKPVPTPQPVVENKPVVETQPPQQSQPIKVETPPQPSNSEPANSSNEELEVKWVPEVGLPIISKIPDHLTEYVNGVQTGIYKRRDRSNLLSYFNVKMIETKEEYNKFLTDFINGNIDLDNDNRAWMNLNYFVNPSLLHTDLSEYKNDKILKEFIKKKSNSFTVDNMGKIQEMFNKFPSPLLNEKSLPGYNSLIESTFKYSDGTEYIVAYVQYFIEEPLEGFNHIYDDSKMILRPTITIPSLKNKSTESYNIDFKYIPKVDGKADLSDIKSEYEISDEYENYVSVKLKKIKPTLSFRAKMSQDLVIEYMSNGTFRVSTNMGTTNLKMSIPNYFNIRSKLDSSVILPYPKNGKFDNMTEQDYIIYSRLYSKIDKTIKINTPETEYDILNKIGFSPLEIETYLVKQMGKDNYSKLKDDVDDSISLTGDVEEDADEILIKMATDSVGLSDKTMLKVLLGLRKNRVWSPNAGAVYKSLITKLKPTTISRIIDMAIRKGYTTPTEVFNELDRVAQTGEPVSFNSPVSFNWKVEPTEYVEYLGKLEKELFEQRMSGMKHKIEIKGIITNYSGTKDIGIVYELVSNKKNDEDNGTYVDTFHRLKHMIKDGAFMATNGYVMEYGFVPFNKDEVIPKHNIAEGIKQYKHLAYYSKWEQDSFLSYFKNIFQKALKEQYAKAREEGKETFRDEDFMEPPTPFELYFGLEQPNSDGTEDKPKEEKLEDINDEPVQEPVKETVEQPVEETVEEPVTQVISEDIDNPDGDKVNPHEILNENIKKEQEENTKIYGNVNSTSWATENKDANYQFILTGAIYAETDFSKIDINKNMLGVVIKVTDLRRGVEQVSKITTVDLFKIVQQGQFLCKNGKVSIDSVSTSSNLVSHCIIDDTIKNMRVLSKKEIPTSIQHYEKLLNEAIEESTSTGNEIKMPELPIARANKPVNKSEIIDEKLVEIVNKKNTVLGEIYKKAVVDSEKHINVVGVTHTHIFYYPVLQSSDKVYSYSLEKLREEQHLFSAFGFVRLVDGSYIVETSTGKYIMLDKNLKEI